MQLTQAAEAAQKRRARARRDDAELAAAIAQEERRSAMRSCARSPTCRSGLHDTFARARRGAHGAQRGATSRSRAAASACARPSARRRKRPSPSAARATASPTSSAAARASSRRSRSSEALHQRLTGERAAIDWTPVEEALQRQLAARSDAEQALAAARDPVEALGAQLRAGEEARLAREQALEPARARIQDMQLKEQAATLAEAQFAEQLAEAQRRRRRAARRAQGAGAARRRCPARSRGCTAAIAELGAVNLAALDELDAVARAQGLPRRAGGGPDRGDGDARDRRSARSTASRASCCSRRSTCVNTNFGKLFPALFGGGQARLVLTGEEILDAGVQVFAQPPGKRISSIHLLSGGEKALTATSLVFALFQLNPAPFCLLDEVDAPLDDPNTERFCRLVREMSAETQFLFISHNKITMELANQLIGITMQEPGVSRVVAVDIAEAIDLAHERREGGVTPGARPLIADGRAIIGRAIRAHRPMRLSTLQIALIVAGILLVVGVLLYNAGRSAAPGGASKARSDRTPTR